MKFSIGDKVILKRTGEEGRIVAYMGKNMVEVEVNGITFPAYDDEVDHPYLKWFTDKKTVSKQRTEPEQLPVEKPKARIQRLAKGVYLSFLPVFKANEMEDIVDYMKVYLLNELPEEISYKYEARFQHQSLFKHEGRLHEFGNTYLHNISFEDMAAQPRFHWEVENTDNKDLEIVADVLRIKPAKLFEQISKLLQNNEPGFSYLLFDEFKPKTKLKSAPAKIDESILKKPQPSHFSRLATDVARYEVDLHIEQLVNSIQGLSNTDMLMIQLETLRKYLDLAIAARLDRMIIIHGLGKGVLKEEVHKILKQTPEVKRYANEWLAQYGFGATIVNFRY